VQVTDPSGLTATDTAVVNVVWDFSGFFPPIDNPPALNAIKAGRVVAIQFSLGGDQGLAISCCWVTRLGAGELHIA
jgi:hypothetical protein